MNLSKLREQIADLKAERNRIDNAIQALEGVLSGFNAEQVVPPVLKLSKSFSPTVGTSMELLFLL